jgi:hypothetical protein
MLSNSTRAFRRIEHRRLPGRHHVPRPAHRRCRVDRSDLAGDQPIEQMADRGEPLLDARRRQLARTGLDPGGDVHRLHRADRRRARACAPSQEFIGGAGKGSARVGVADIRGEEFEEAHTGSVAGGGDKRGQCGWSGADELVRAIPHVSNRVKSRRAVSSTT